MHDKAFKFYLTSSLFDSLSTGIHMKLYKDAIWREGNETVRNIVLKYGVEKGLMFYELTHGLPICFAIYTFCRIVDLLRKDSERSAEKTILYFVGSGHLFGAYSWLHGYELNFSNNYLINTFLFFLPMTLLLTLSYHAIED